jgi:hypothetical protein
MAILHPLATVEYPSSDGLPMAESDFQRKSLTYAVLEARVRGMERRQE